MLDGFDTTRIAGSLRYGLLDESKHFMLGVVIGIILLVSVVAVGITMIAIELAKGGLAVGSGIGGIISLIFALVSVGFFLVGYAVKNVKHRKEVMRWLDDAVELKAFARKVGESDIIDSLDGPRKYRIRVSFKYNGNRCKFTSSTESHWRDYCDKEIDILYSPQFNQVILLK